MKSWKTTVCGILTFVLVAISSAAIPILDADPLTIPTWTVVGGAFATMIGFFVARDNNVTSEQAGVK